MPPVLDRMILSGVAAASISARTCAFRSGFSGTFSCTRSAARVAWAAVETKRSMWSGGCSALAMPRSTRAGEQASALWRCGNQDFLASEARADGLRIQRAHFCAWGVQALNPFVKVDLPQPVVELVDHVAIDAATRRVVQDNVTPCANQLV